MTQLGSFKYVEGWFAVVVGKDGLIDRLGPFDTEAEANEERDAFNGVKHEKRA